MIPAPVVDGRRFDWFARFDPRSRRYAAAAGATTLPGSGRLWSPGRERLDQGREGACCGFAAAHEASASPVPVPGVTDQYARGWYLNAQRRDEWPGEAYDGTSVLATMQEGVTRGLFGGYTWAFSVEELAHAIVKPAKDGGGPAVAGVEWRSGSYDTDHWGVLRPSGDVVGGHALALLGFVPAGVPRKGALWSQLQKLDLAIGVEAALATESGAFIALNSWGPLFGRNGLCVVPVSVVRGWFAARGEFALPVDRRQPRRKGMAMAESDDQDQGQEQSDSTLHLTAQEVRDGDRILDPPDQVGQESATVRGTPQVVRDWRGTRVVVNSTAGTFQYGSRDPVTVRRAT